MFLYAGIMQATHVLQKVSCIYICEYVANEKLHDNIQKFKKEMRKNGTILTL